MTARTIQIPSALDRALIRFPNRIQEVTSLYAQSPTFREICADDAEMGNWIETHHQQEKRPASTLDDAKEVVSLGDVAYWPQGKAMCLFFGKTPVSKGEEIRPASPVNVIGKIKGDPKVLGDVKQGDKIVIERV